MTILQRLAVSRAPRFVILIRLLVGAVFFSEGVQKFLYPATLGAGRFAKIGFPAPQILAPFVGCVEIVCGTLVILGLFTRIASLLLLIVISVAIVTTKLPMLAHSNVWDVAHETRTDYSMLMGLLFLIIVGAGPLALDRFVASRARPR